MGRAPFKYEVGQHLDIGRFHGTIMEQFIKKDKKYYKYKCDNCGYEGEKEESLLTEGSGCPGCIGRVVVPGFNDIPSTANWMIKYFQGGIEEAKNYTRNSTKRIFPVCPHCGRVREKTLTVNSIYCSRGFSCTCRDGVTIPNKIIYNIMDQMFNAGQIKHYENEYMIDKSFKKLYDMYFVTNNDKKYIVEMDGGIGHGHSNSRNSFFNYDGVTTLESDRMKDEYAEKHGIEVIRINCEISDVPLIKNEIFNSKLSQILPLDLIDWNEVAEYAYKNLAKIVCEYKKDHPELFTTDVAKIFHMNRTTVADYWKKGSTFGWCEYNPKDEANRFKRERWFYKPKSKPVIVRSEDGEERIFKSISDLEENSTALYGYKLWGVTVSPKVNTINYIKFKNVEIRLLNDKEKENYKNGRI